VRIAIERAASGTSFDIQLNLPRLHLEATHGYAVQFRARADAPRTMAVGVAEAHAPWAGLGWYHRVELSPVWQTFSAEFVALRDDTNARIHFDLGESDIAVDIGSVSLRRLADSREVEPRTGGSDRRLSPDALAGWDKPIVPVMTGEASPRFSVVIPTYQRRELVVASVQALARQTFEGAFEIVVVVDGSTDGSADALRALDVPVPVMVLEQPNSGAATARNAGARAARGTILLFLDDDMEADGNLLRELDRSHRAGADVVFGHIPLHTASPSNFLSDGIRQWADGRLERLMMPGESLTLHDLMTGQMSLARTLFERVGGFDASFTRDGTFGDEDIDFGYRLMRDGYHLVFNPDAISYQNYVVQPAHYLRQYRETGRADVAFARKHPEQASTIFALNGSQKPINRLLWRPLAALGPVGTPILDGLRWLALKRVRGGWPSNRAIRFFYQIWAMEYWRGVHEAGGVPRTQQLRVLAYHQIADLESAPVVAAYGVPPARFRRQVRLLQWLGFHFVSPDQFLSFLQGTVRLPPRSLLLTFDDAYADLLEVVPFLKRRKVPGIVFVVSAQLAGSNTWDEAIGAPRLDLLDAPGLRTLAEASIEAGAHSRTHRPLTELSDRELEDEVDGSLADLHAAGIGRPRMFAYPEGAYDGRVTNRAKSAGLEACFTIAPGVATPGQDPFRIPRIEILRSDGTWGCLRKVIKAGHGSQTRTSSPEI
jgi:glycosyltransferase involved in cell wall biosynthesis/peptidoglycan/xylan/chitin deacetylase (PgdA/CDA1 family)